MRHTKTQTKSKEASECEVKQSTRDCLATTKQASTSNERTKRTKSKRDHGGRRGTGLLPTVHGGARHHGQDVRRMSMRLPGASTLSPLCSSFCDRDCPPRPSTESSSCVVTRDDSRDRGGDAVAPRAQQRGHARTTPLTLFTHSLTHTCVVHRSVSGAGTRSRTSTTASVPRAARRTRRSRSKRTRSTAKTSCGERSSASKRKRPTGATPQPRRSRPRART